MQSLGDWGPHVTYHQPIPAGDAGTLSTTVPWMRRLVIEGRSDPTVQARVGQIVEANPQLHPIDACYRHVQSMPYKFDEDIAKSRGLDDGTVEVLQGAPYQAARDMQFGPGSVEGDCDCRAIYLQSMLESMGYKTGFVLVDQPGQAEFTHVYSTCTLENGRELVLDTIFDGVGGRKWFNPGDEVPAHSIQRRQVFPVNPSPLGWLFGLGALLLI